MASGTTIDIDNRWDPFTTAPELVRERFEDGWAAAQGAYQTTMEAVQRLENIAGDLNTINRVIEIDTARISTGEISVDPPTLDLSLLRVDSPDMPVDPALINTDMEVFPEYPDLVVGDIPPPNEIYTSALLTALKAKFLADVQSGGTGISPAVETAIFQRQYERDLLIHNDTMDEIAATRARGKYPIPNGSLIEAQNKEITKFGNKRLDVSRDISIKSFELAFQHTEFVMLHGVGFESQLMNWAHGVAILASDVSKAVVDAQLRIFAGRTDGTSKKIMGIIEKAKAKIDHNRGLIEVFNGKVNGYAAKIRGEGDRVNAVARGYEAQVGLFRGVSDFEIQKIGLDLKALELAMNKTIANANILIKDKEIESRHYEVLNTLKAEVMKAAGAIASQLTAGAMAGTNASAHISASASSTYSPRWTWTAEGGWVLS